MVVGRRVTQLAVQNETRRSHVDDQFAAGTIIDFPSGMMAFESKVRQLLDGGMEALVVAFSSIVDRHFGTRNTRPDGIREDAFFDRTAVAAPIEADFYAGNFGIAQRVNDSCLEPLDFTLRLRRAFGLADSKVRHDCLKISHEKSPDMCGQAPIVLPTITSDLFPLTGCASADSAGAMPDASVGILRRALGGSAQRTTAIYNRDPTGFGFDDEALQDSVSGKGDDITG
jgi:hypothetical protein